MIRFFSVFFLLLLSGVVEAQSSKEKIIKDLRDDWKIFSNNQYQKYDPSKNTRIVYFLINADEYRGAALRIGSQKEFSVFVDGKLIDSKKQGVILYDLDSLSNLYPSPFTFSLVLPDVEISTHLVIRANELAESLSLEKRKEQFFLNFSILAAIVLLIFFVILLRTNPKLTFDYLNFVKLFSVQEREENIMVIRITSSANLLYYTFASLFASFIIMVIFHFAYADLSLAAHFQVTSLKDSFSQWIKLTFFILLVLVGKLLLISVFSYLYRATEITALQFFNFIRLFFFTFGVISLLMVFFFIAKVLSPAWYFNLFYVAAAIFIFWEFIIFLKLMSRVSFRIFHLFFYLCASELIPFVILIKVVFY